MTEPVHGGSCPCGAVSFEVTGKPFLSIFCHCTLCQRRFSSPFVHSIHFVASAFKWTHNEPHDAALVTFPKGGNFKCKKCGADVAYADPEGKEYIVWGAGLERDAQGKIKDWDTVKPTAHIFYNTRMVDVDDQVGKWAGFENHSERL